MKTNRANSNSILFSIFCCFLFVAIILNFWVGLSENYWVRQSYYVSIIFGFVIVGSVRISKVLRNGFFYLLNVLSILCALIIDVKFILLGPFVFAGYLIFIENIDPIKTLLVILLFLNLLVMVLQVSGLYSFLHSYQNYYNGPIPDGLNYLQNPTVTQIRPTGGFANTIYLTIFMFLCSSILLFSSSMVKPSIVFLIAFCFVLSGSTFGILFTVFFLFFGPNQYNAFRLFKYYSVCLFVYFTLLPEVFFIINFSFHDFSNSIFTRLGFLPGFLLNEDLDSGFLWILLILSFIVGVLLRKLNVCKHLSRLNIWSFFSLLAPLVLHPFFSSFVWWFFCGLIFAARSAEIKKIKVSKIDNLVKI